jgi:hypothetical protein
MRYEGNRGLQLVETLALSAQAMAAGARAQVLALNVVARVAVGVVVIDIALVRMPRRFLCHAM